MPGPAPYSGVYYSGKNCAVVCNGQNIHCGEWEATKAVDKFDLTTGASSPAKESGLGDYEITGSFMGPIDGSVSNPFPSDVPVLMSMVPGSGATPLAGYAILHNIKASTKTSDAYRFTVQFTSVGPWTGI